jgi:hypothetical protein
VIPTPAREDDPDFRLKATFWLLAEYCRTEDEFYFDAAHNEIRQIMDAQDADDDSYRRKDITVNLYDASMYFHHRIKRRKEGGKDEG